MPPSPGRLLTCDLLGALEDGSQIVHDRRFRRATIVATKIGR